MTEAPLAYGEKQTITVKTELHEAQDGDVVVNKAVGRAENTKMRMRTSAQFTVTDTREPEQTPEPSPTPEQSDARERGLAPTGTEVAGLTGFAAVVLMGGLLLMRRARQH
ncbi:hypothetical protein [Pseudoglutamicibacter albus]|uniref:Uncharacterized protein n=1 Tax=Pseudoglutamicibacter albus DNF00011 TaxID=1401063 RepID=A0A095YCU7_9MICC|nr:hypothetical protein [Pseudoglutamicibacter albus]KGF20068.1 hypothetical protein HMPREF2128_07270 [Pseudoglutamicibacter albus DNF00011]